MVTVYFFLGATLGGALAGLTSIVIVGDLLGTTPSNFGKDVPKARKAVTIIFCIGAVLGALIGMAVASCYEVSMLYGILSAAMAGIGAALVPFIWAKAGNSKFQLGLVNFVRLRMQASTQGREDLLAIQEQLSSTRALLARACNELALPEETRKQRDRLALLVGVETGTLQNRLQELDKLRADADKFRQFRLAGLEFQDLEPATVLDLAVKAEVREQMVKVQSDLVVIARDSLNQAASALQALLEAATAKPAAVEDVLAASQSAIAAAHQVVSNSCRQEPVEFPAVVRDTVPRH